MRVAILGLLLSVLLAGCGGDDRATSTTAAQTRSHSGGGRFPDVTDVTLTPTSAGAYTVGVTISSPYDTPERYADGWRVLAAGTDRVLGTHTLGHDHADEQPFTRVQEGLKVPAGVRKVTVEGRDRRHGYGGASVTVNVPAG